MFTLTYLGILSYVYVHHTEVDYWTERKRMDLFWYFWSVLPSLLWFITIPAVIVGLCGYAFVHIVLPRVFK